MFERLQIRSFQCHERFVIEFDPLVTAIVGRSDVGKSAILRALKWVCFNRPTGNQFIRSGAAACSVTLQLDGSRSVRRKKGKGRNHYYCGAQLYAAFGSGIPPDIQNFLNLDQISFAGQHDPPFWLSLSPGEVSRELNRVVNLDLIDKTLASIGAEYRKARTEVEVSQDRLKAAREERDRLAWVKEADADLKKVEEKYNEVNRIVQERSRLVQIVEEGKRVRERIAIDSRRSQTALKGIGRLERLLQRADRARERAGKLTNLINEVKIVEESACRTKDMLGRVERELAEVKTCPACGRTM